MEHKKFTKIVKIATICATCFLVIMLGIIIGQYIKLGNLKRQENELDTTLASMNEQRLSLEQGISNRMSYAYLEQQAREQLGMIKEGETLYIYS